MKEPILALLYDFDNTLASSDMQNFSFIPKILHMEPSEFWNLTNEIFKKWDMDKVLCYMYCMVNICKEKGIKLTRSLLNDCGKDIKFLKELLLGLIESMNMVLKIMLKLSTILFHVVT